MISPEVLRRNPFFGKLTDNQLSELAMIAEKVEFAAGEVVFNEGDPANALFFLLDGCIDLYFTIAGIKPEALEKGLPVGEINPGEPFGISALIEPYIFTSTACAARSSQAIRFGGMPLRELMKTDRRLAYYLYQSAAKAALERLHATRVQLAAAWA